MKDDHQHEQLRDTIAKAIADSIGHGMREKCERHADAVMAILDAEGGVTGEADKQVAESSIEPMLLEQIISTLLAAPGTSAWGSTVTLYVTDAASMIVTLRQILAERTNPRSSRPGRVSDADVDDACRAYIAADRFLLDGAVESMREPMRAALTQFAKGERHE